MNEVNNCKSSAKSVLVSLPKNWTHYNPKINNKKQLILGNEKEQIYRQPDFGNFKRVWVIQTAKELSRKYGFHYQTLHDWKKKFSGITSTKELQKIKELEKSYKRKKILNLTQQNNWKMCQLFQDNTWHQRGQEYKDESSNFWKFFKPVIEREIQNGNLHESFFGRFDDENALRNGEQIYGYYLHQVQIYPIVDVKNVDNRRKQIGLPPLLYNNLIYGMPLPQGYSMTEQELYEELLSHIQ